MESSRVRYRAERAIPSGISGRLFRRNEFPFDSVRRLRLLCVGRPKQESWLQPSSADTLLEPREPRRLFRLGPSRTGRPDTSPLSRFVGSDLLRPYNLVPSPSIDPESGSKPRYAWNICLVTDSSARKRFSEISKASEENPVSVARERQAERLPYSPREFIWPANRLCRI